MSKWTYVYLDGIKITSLDSNEDRSDFASKLEVLDQSMRSRVTLVNDWDGSNFPIEDGMAHSDSHHEIHRILIDKTPCHSVETISEPDFFAAMNAAFSS